MITGRVNNYSSWSSRNRYVDQYTTLKNAKTKGNVIREITSILLDLVGNLDSHDRQQFSRLGCMWISHWRAFSIARAASPRCPTRGFCKRFKRKINRRFSNNVWNFKKKMAIRLVFFITLGEKLNMANFWEDFLNIFFPKWKELTHRITYSLLWSI